LWESTWDYRRVEMKALDLAVKTAATRETMTVGTRELQTVVSKAVHSVSKSAAS
jgi:hypothetical protein